MTTRGYILLEGGAEFNTEKVIKGLDLVPRACVIPHHDTFGQNWVPKLSRLLPDTTLLGIDEQTGIPKQRSTERVAGLRKGGCYPLSG